MAWLAALARDTSLRVPAPVLTDRDGAHVVAAAHPGVPETRPCVLLRWLDGRFLNRGLTPAHLELVSASCWPSSRASRRELDPTVGVRAPAGRHADKPPPSGRASAVRRRTQGGRASGRPSRTANG